MNSLSPGDSPAVAISQRVGILEVVKCKGEVSPPEVWKQRRWHVGNWIFLGVGVTVLWGNGEIFTSSASLGIMRMGWSWPGVFISLRAARVSRASGLSRLCLVITTWNSVLLMRRRVHLGQLSASLRWLWNPWSLLQGPPYRWEASLICYFCSFSARHEHPGKSLPSSIQHVMCLHFSFHPTRHPQPHWPKHFPNQSS